MARATRAVARIDAALTEAKADGLLSFFNQTYALRRRQAPAAGQCFPAYALVFTRFKRAIYKRATSEQIDKTLIAEVLGKAMPRET